MEERNEKIMADERQTPVINKGNPQKDSVVSKYAELLDKFENGND